MDEANIRLKPVGFLTDAVRRRTERRILEENKRATAERRGIRRQIEKAQSDYRRQLVELMGRSNMRRYRALRAELARVPRARRIRQARKWLADTGVDLARAETLRRRHIAAVRALFETSVAQISPDRQVPLECRPWVTYTAPYDGHFSSSAWSRSDGPDDPVINRYLEPRTGRIGSSISTRLSDADDDESMHAESYTSLNVWHTVLATGVLEGYVTFEFNASTYSGQIRDEFGFSDALVTQYARVRFRAVDTAGASETQVSGIYAHFDNVWGDDASWNRYVAGPRDRHSYFFRTSFPFEQGRAVLLEAGIDHVTTFGANDQSITTASNLDLRLDRIQVRSCAGPLIL